MDMQMTNRVPDWLTPVAWTYIALSLIAAAYIAFDIYARRHRHSSVAAELVWVTSGLYLGPFAVPLYHRHRRLHAYGDPAERAGTQQPIAVAGLPAAARPPSRTSSGCRWSSPLASPSPGSTCG
jgi:hypothetical protein